ncbi:MAG: hypothetical protein Q7U10_10260 [Thermodesulfovibrionia bacterium]|nr:hypothetical protein [Thermodesulfovibrionia bacterium]
MKIISAIIFVLILSSQSFSADIGQLTGNAAEVYKRAQGGRRFADSVKLNPEIMPTSDGRSFIVVWKVANKKVPEHWIVSLHGSNGFATDDLAIWYQNIKDRDIGLISVQWWIGADDNNKSYYKPMQVYSEIDIALQKIGVKPGTVMLHGFSRGSANSYAIAALDAGQGKHYFSLIVASSGGVNLDYPPTRSIVEGAFGDHPLRNTRWITVAGARDKNPDRDGIPGMKRTAIWLQEQGATVIERIEDPNEGHGALMLNSRNARHVLDLFFNNKE